MESGKLYDTALLVGRFQTVRKPGKNPRYVFLEENENRLLLVSDDTNTSHAL